MIGGVIKYFRMSYDTVLWEISFSNINMLLATIPSMELDEKTKEVDSLAELEDLFKD